MAEYNFGEMAQPFRLVVSKLGELLNKVKKKADDERKGLLKDKKNMEDAQKHLNESAVVLKNAVDNLNKLLTSVGVVPAATVTDLASLSVTLSNATESGNSVDLGIAGLKLICKCGDVLELVLGAAAGVVAGLGLGLKNICYQLGSLVHQDFAGGVKPLTGPLAALGLDAFVGILDKEMSLVIRAAGALPEDYYDSMLKVFTTFSMVINVVFQKVGKASIVGSEKPQEQDPPEDDVIHDPSQMGPDDVIHDPSQMGPNYGIHDPSQTGGGGWNDPSSMGGPSPIGGEWNGPSQMGGAWNNPPQMGGPSPMDGAWNSPSPMGGPSQMGGEWNDPSQMGGPSPIDGAWNGPSQMGRGRNDPSPRGRWGTGHRR